jgi:hypothetical protein
VKVFHALFLLIFAIGALYLFHMLTAHQGKQILPGIGVNGVNY